MDKLRFFSIGSGSSGNCYYFGNSTRGILIDAGLSPRTIRKELKQIGVDFSNIMGIFVTHDHQDHIKSIGTLGEKFNIPIYATAKTHRGMDQSYGMTQKLSSSKRFLENGQNINIGEFNIASFPVSHDGTDNGGFFIKYRNHRILFATDLGYVTDPLFRFIQDSNIIILEANYDLEMLKNGKYPFYLKQRVLSNTGHLGNMEAGTFLADHWHPELKHIYLCHLSNDNNHPELAKKTVEMCMAGKGIRSGLDVDVVALKRSATELIIFD